MPSAGTVIGGVVKLSRCLNLAVSVFVALSMVTIFDNFQAQASQTCLTGNDPAVAGDAANINAVRALVNSACVCASFDGSKGKTHGAYVKCAADIINAQVDVPGALRPQCKGTVTKIYAQSTCGSNPALHKVACIKKGTQSGKVSCAIKPTTKKDGTPNDTCVAGKTSTAVACHGLTHCLNAADTNGDLIIAAPADTGECLCPYSIPSGSYFSTCIDCSISSSCDLTCTCAPIGVELFECPGACSVSSIPLPCGADVANINGHLTCQ